MREKILFNNDWNFHRGDIKQDYPRIKAMAYRSAKTERYLMGPASQNYMIPGVSVLKGSKAEFKSEYWEKITLPHDYMAGDEPDSKYNEALGFCNYDNAWYLKRFTLSEDDRNKRLTLLFDGVATHATVMLNGCLLKHNFCGYTPFEVDITDMAKFGDTETNFLAVYVSTEEHEGWWYEGAGIYRNVWLIKTEKVSIDLWGVYANPQKGEGDLWTVKTEVTLRNDTQTRKSTRVLGEILDADGNIIAASEAAGMVADREKRTLHYDFKVENPRLWSPDDPYQYTMRTTLYAGKKEVDQTTVKFGFRTIRADKDEGLFINEKKYIIKGVCCHENCGLTGKYVPDNIQRYRVKMLKEMGANGYRTSHYPQSEAMMDALDENGFIVMNETRWFESTDEGKQQLETLVKRDRNRPGVIFWSLGNEEPHHCTEQGIRILRSLVPFVRKLDPSNRLIMTAITHAAAICYDEVDVVGTNYMWKYIDEVHAKAAHKPFVSSECAATGTTRGWYFDDDPGRGFIKSYDHDINKAFISRENTWKAIMSRPWFMGGYQWTGFEYRGEAVWPRLCSQSGAIDLYLQRKDAFYQNQSHWLETPMIHAIPHWNLRGREGEIIDVWAYTNQRSAELFLNGNSLGKREIEQWGHAEWKVPFAAGELKVVAYGADGRIVAEDIQKTTGAPAALKLRLENPDLKSGDLAVVTCYVVDADGNEVPDACPTVRFMGGGAAKIYSTGSSVADHKTIFSPERTMYMGRITVGVKIKEAGICKVYAEAEGLLTASLCFAVEE